MYSKLAIKKTMESTIGRYSTIDRTIDAEVDRTAYCGNERGKTVCAAAKPASRNDIALIENNNCRILLLAITAIDSDKLIPRF